MSRYRKGVPRFDDFPSLLSKFVYVGDSKGEDLNLLILFHGVGDNAMNFIRFAKSLGIPQTALLSLQAPLPLLDLGFQWFPWFDEQGNEIEYDEARLSTLVSLRQELKRFLVTLSLKYKWSYANMILLGFSQGAIVAVDLMSHWNLSPPLAACVGSVLEELMARYSSSKDLAFSTDIKSSLFLTHGTRDDRVPINLAKKRISFLKEKLKGAEIVVKEYSKGHAMVSSQAEARDLVEFLAKRLKRIDTSLADNVHVVEVTPETLKHITIEKQ